MGIQYRSFDICRVLQFDDADGYSVHKEKHVGTAVLAALLHYKLVDASENVSFWVLEVNVFEFEGFALFWGKVIAVTIKIEGFLERVVFVLSTYQTKILHDAAQLALGKLLDAIATIQIVSQVAFY